LPFETETMILETAKRMNELEIDAVKLHPMHIVKGSKLADVYKDMEFYFLDFDKYLELLVKFLSYLDNNIIIHGT
jgi:radical SAM superfamily enzyme